MSAGDRPEIDTASFTALARLVADAAGIVLNDGKRAMVSSRLRPRLDALACASWRDYIALVEPPGADERVRMLDLLTTNVTSFFREADHFIHLAEHLRQRAPRRLRLWCAAAATGEEPWSLAMTLAEQLPAGCDWLILATDLSTRALAAAEAGRYPAQALDTVAPDRRRRWFREDGGHLRVADALRQQVRFARLNLIEFPYPMRGPLDIIAIRNVMIYFDAPTRTRVLQACAGLLAPDGLLYVGHTESLAGLDVPLASVAPAVYRRA